MSQTSLQRAQAKATLVATIAVPIIVAALGVSIQMSISAESIRKDYVQLAVGILGSPNSDQHLREFATDVLSKNSPVPFTSKVRTSFVNPELRWLPGITDSPMMKDPALPWIDPPDSVTSGDLTALLENYRDNMTRARMNYYALIHLRDAINKTAAIENEYWQQAEDQSNVPESATKAP